jgi:hypothetical protein
MKEINVMRRLVTLLLFGLVAACGKVDNPTPPSTKLTTWTRASAVLTDTSAADFRGKTHPLASATVIGEPQKRTYTVRLTDPENDGYAFDVVIESAKVSWKDGDDVHERWGTLSAEITLTANEAFAITGKCDDKVTSVLGAPGEVTNTVLSCDVTGKRPNRMGTKDAITIIGSMQIEGNGKLSAYGSGVTMEEKK